MTAKTSSTKKKAAKKAPVSKAKADVKAPVKAKPAAAKAKPAATAAKPETWAQTMKKALAAKSSGRSGPDQGKPRDSGVQPVRKNAF